MRSRGWGAEGRLTMQVTMRLRKPLLVIAATCALMVSLQRHSPAEGPIAPEPPQAVPPTAHHHTVQQMACAERGEIVRALRETYGEKPVAHGLADSGVLAEIFSSPQGAWTIVATTPNGVSCLIGSGRSFQTTAALDDSI